MFTTRLSNLVSQVDDSRGIHVAFLDEDSSWNLFSKTVFEEQGCPLELEETGKKIVKNCKGRPLSIVVIGGLLVKSERTRKYWEYTLEHLNSIVNLEDNERVLQILYMSYNNLPLRLKPCFLYMGVFKEDSSIRVSELVKLWLAEGFIRPIDDQCLEEIGKEYLQELADRNLILVEKRKYNGKVKSCKIHDLLRDLCLREARKVNFFYVLGEQGALYIPQDINTERRICIHASTQQQKYSPELLHALSVARSAFIWRYFGCDFPSFSSRFLRVYSGKYTGEHIFQQVNLRYITLEEFYLPQFPSSVSLLWNVQTLISGTINGCTIPLEIWKMPLLRHLKVIGATLPDPTADDIVVLKNLQTLVQIVDFKCSEEVVKRIPNIKKLKLVCSSHSLDNHNFSSVGHLNKLESLEILFEDPFLSSVTRSLTIPTTLKKFTLDGCCEGCNWEEMLEKIGSLPLLEKLKLIQGSFEGGKWETIEGQFRSLKFLQIEHSDLEYWRTESSHFPLLEHVILKHLPALMEIPSEIGEIPTLKSIVLSACSYSAIISAKRVIEEQEELQGEVGFQVRIERCFDDSIVQLAVRLKNPNFQVE